MMGTLGPWAWPGCGKGSHDCLTPIPQSWQWSHDSVILGKFLRYHQKLVKFLRHVRKITYILTNSTNSFDVWLISLLPNDVSSRYRYIPVRSSSLLLIYGKEKSQKLLPAWTCLLTPDSVMELRQTLANQSWHSTPCLNRAFMIRTK